MREREGRGGLDHRPRPPDQQDQRDDEQQMVPSGQDVIHPDREIAAPHLRRARSGRDRRIGLFRRETVDLHRPFARGDAQDRFALPGKGRPAEPLPRNAAGADHRCTADHGKRSHVALYRPRQRTSGGQLRHGAAFVGRACDRLPPAEPPVRLVDLLELDRDGTHFVGQRRAGRQQQGQRRNQPDHSIATV